MKRSAHGERVERASVSDDGQATVEVALVLPVIVLLLMAVVQVGLIVHDRLLVTGAAREAARAFAVSGSAEVAQRAARAPGGLVSERLRVHVTRELASVPDASGVSLVVVRVTYTVVTDVPLAGSLLPDIDVVADAVMSSEVA
jgi:Flp pilus assembly protein TadG